MTIKNFYLPSKRSFVEQFYVMNVLAKSKKLEKKGKNIFHLELGEPFSKTPKKIINEAKKLINLNLPGYTPSNGIFELRNEISKFYLKKNNLKISSDNIFITVGSSGAFLLSFLSCFNPKDTVGVLKPSYPAYKNILKSLSVNVLEIESYGKDDFKINLNEIEKYKKLNGLIISNPNNPTGQMFSYNELKFIYDFCKKNNIILISDEIYHGIEFEKKSYSMYNFGKDVIIINSFSKYFCMPGWRLGWVVIPKTLIDNFLRLSQNLFISSGNIAQYSAIKAFNCIDEYSKNTKLYMKNRDFVFKTLKETPWQNFSKTDGSFYTYIDTSKFAKNSMQLVDRILSDTGVALTPGIDFDQKNGKNAIRLSFSADYKIIQSAMLLLKKWINKNY